MMFSYITTTRHLSQAVKNCYKIGRTFVCDRHRSWLEKLVRRHNERGFFTSAACEHTSVYFRHMASDGIPEGVLMGMGNPLLDITIATDEAFLKKYGLEANNAIMVDTVGEMFDDMTINFSPQYVAGGATQNSIRIAQWILERENATTFFGGVGNDKNAEILRAKGREAGVNVQYCVDPEHRTGLCGAVITGHNRSLVAYLGAAQHFKKTFIEENWNLVEKARLIYIGGFFFPVCKDGIFSIAQHALDNDKTLVMNLSAPFLCEYFADQSEGNDIMPYVDVLFGNETEAATFCQLRGIKATTIEEMALETSKLPKKNSKRSRLVIFTQGCDPTVICHDGKVKSYEILPVDKALIKDTNGCGDSFVGGFLAELVKGGSIEDCVKTGQLAARVVIQHWGCTFPPKFEYK